MSSLIHHISIRPRLLVLRLHICPFRAIPFFTPRVLLRFVYISLTQPLILDSKGIVLSRGLLRRRLSKYRLLFLDGLFKLVFLLLRQMFLEIC